MLRTRKIEETYDPNHHEEHEDEDETMYCRGVLIARRIEETHVDLLGPGSDKEIRALVAYWNKTKGDPDLGALKLHVRAVVDRYGPEVEGAEEIPDETSDE